MKTIFVIFPLGLIETVLFLLFVSCSNLTENYNESETVTDIDGNVYHSVKIGNQIWTVENLRTTKLNDGSAIPLVTDGSEWNRLSTPAYCYYNNTTNADTIRRYGALYTGLVIGTGRLAPLGWKIPDTTDWNILETYLITNGFNWDGTKTGNKIAKSLAADTDWYVSTEAGAIGNDLSLNNRSGFSALPAGSRNSGFEFGFPIATWWSATKNGASVVYYRRLIWSADSLYRGGASTYFGFSVRLIKEY